MSKNKKIVNVAASVKEKLLNAAKENKQSFNLVFRQYVQERFLYRLTNSIYAKNFILKGALLFIAFDMSKLRPTRDIDFEGTNISNDAEGMLEIFKEIALIEAEDGLSFDSESIIAEDITEVDEYNGVRIRLKAKMGTASQALQIDIGFGDIIHRGPVEITYPVLLDFPAPVILAYTIESAIAEKYEAIVSIGLATSRMKDFYDIIFFANKYKFESKELLEAIKLTFGNRNTDISGRNFIYDNTFKSDPQKQTQWAAFLSKNKLQADNKFGNTVNKIQQFIEPLFNFVDTDTKTWNPDIWEWEE